MAKKQSKQQANGAHFESEEVEALKAIVRDWQQYDILDVSGYTEAHESILEKLDLEV